MTHEHTHRPKIGRGIDINMFRGDPSTGSGGFSIFHFFVLKKTYFSCVFCINRVRRMLIRRTLCAMFWSAQLSVRLLITAQTSVTSNTMTHGWSLVFILTYRAGLYDLLQKNTKITHVGIPYLCYTLGKSGNPR